MTVKTLPSSLQELTPETSEALLQTCEKELAKKDPFSLIEDGHLWIKTKEGELKPLVLNKAQKHLNEIVKKLWYAKKIIRLWILKARQLGISTYIEALIYAITSQTENVDSLIVADDQKDSIHIFEMSKLYQERCPDHIKPLIKRSNEKKLEFDKIHSQILIDTAENKDAGRNFTFRLVHLSNYAFFPYPQDLMRGLSNSVPSLPNTIIAKETTSKGLNFAKDEWDRIMQGKLDWTPIFLPWFWDEGYKMNAEGLILGDKTLGDLTSNEPYLKAIMEKEDIDSIPERLAWRRWKIENDLEGDIYAFKQEFPSTPEEAFEAIVGNPRFDIKALNELRRKCIAPTRGNLEYSNGELEFIESAQGIVEIYNFPTERTKGSIGVDISRGVEKDRSSASFVNYNTLTEDAVVNTDKLDPAQFAAEIWKLGHFYNKALIIPEVNDSGLAFTLPLVNGQTLNGKTYKAYTNIYYREIIDQEDGKVTKKYGFTTNMRTKPIIIDTLATMIREMSITIPAEATIRECSQFVIDEKGKMGAVEGTHDDRVIALSLACYGYMQRPTVELPETQPRAERWY